MYSLQIHILKNGQIDEQFHILAEKYKKKIILLHYTAPLYCRFDDIYYSLTYNFGICNETFMGQGNWFIKCIICIIK